MNYEMPKSRRTNCIIPPVLFCLASAAWAQTTAPAMPSAGMPHSNLSQGNMQKGTMGSDGMRQSMMKGMDSMHKMQMSGDTDKDFAMMMKMHHQQGVEMAQMELANGKSPVMKSMAKNIISAQNKEIAKFDKWLAGQK